MAGGAEDKLQQLFVARFGCDPSGRDWLPALLAAVPGGRASLGELLDDPGALEIPLAVTGANGRLACFDYPSAPPRSLLAWFIDHPDELVWPEDAEHSPVSERLRGALLRDDPPGARAKAQDRAHDLMSTASSLSSDWWRFEDASRLECVLLTDRLVLVVESDPRTPATGWYPQRTRLVRDLEAARALARDRAYATLVLGEHQLSAEELPELIAAGTPHLTRDERDELAAGYLGALTWERASSARARSPRRGRD
jgi:hypothetical protein